MKVASSRGDQCVVLLSFKLIPFPGVLVTEDILLYPQQNRLHECYSMEDIWFTCSFIRAFFVITAELLPPLQFFFQNHRQTAV
jgi:hypothetical protein